MKIKKIALINPKKALHDENPRFYEMLEKNRDYLKLWYAPPLSLLTIAALTPVDIEVTIIDEHYQSIDFNEPYDLIGLTAMTQQAYRAYEIAHEYSKRQIPVVLGGIHATILPDEALQHVNTVFIGEAEELWPKFLSDCAHDTQKKVYKADHLFDLKNSIKPRYDLIDFKKYNQINDYFKFLPVQATRGCPHDCSFCVTTKFYGHKIRKKEIQQILEEINNLKGLSNNSLILFVDDNLFVDRQFALALLKELIPLKIKYIAQSDVKIANDPELLELAYQSGCIMVFIGFESLSSAALMNVNRNSWKMKQVDKYTDSIKKIQEQGIIVFGAFIIGFENDSSETFEVVKNFVIKTNIPGQFTLLTPLPGSRDYDTFKKEGKLLQDNFWNKCSFFNMTFRHPKISPEEAEEKIIWIHNEIFSEEISLQRNLHMIKIYKNLAPRYSLKN